MKFAPLAAAIAALCFYAPAALADDTVKIGVSGPLSGANAFAGKDDENGVRLAIEELNAKKAIKVGGKVLRFELLSEDDQGDPKAGVIVAQKFADAGVHFVLGPYNSGVALPAARVYNNAGIMMSTVGTNPKITSSGYKMVFRTVASDAQVGAQVAAYAAKNLKLKTVGVIDDRTAFGQGIAMEFTRQAKALGMTVAGQEFTTDKATDFASILTRLKAKKVDAIFFGGYAPQAAPMARQMKALGINAKLLGGDAVGENVLCAQAGAILEKQKAGPAFQARYKARFKQNPDVYAAAFYDQTMFIAEAMGAANSLDPSVVAAAMRASSHAGVVGSYSYDADGNLKASTVTMYTFKNGAPVALQN